MHRLGDPAGLDLRTLRDRPPVHLIDGGVPQCQPAGEVVGAQRIPVVELPVGQHLSDRRPEATEGPRIGPQVRRRRHRRGRPESLERSRFRQNLSQVTNAALGWVAQLATMNARVGGRAITSHAFACGSPKKCAAHSGPASSANSGLESFPASWSSSACSFCLSSASALRTSRSACRRGSTTFSTYSLAFSIAESILASTSSTSAGRATASILSGWVSVPIMVTPCPRAVCRKQSVQARGGSGKI